MHHNKVKLSIMNKEDLYKIYSEDYADFLLDYSGNISMLNQYANAAVRTINFFTAAAYVPIELFTEDIISRINYDTVPTLFELTSEEILEASGIRRIRNVPNFDLRGNGVLIGIVDTGIAYTNPVFQYADKTTKIEILWDQTIISDNYPEDMFYGTEYTEEQINLALSSENPYEIVPSVDDIGHGTMVAGISAGNEDPENGFLVLHQMQRLQLLS